MIFGTLPVADAEGAILAHAVKAAGATLRKGRKLSAGDVASLQAAGVAEVIGAKLEPSDEHEDVAATRIAKALMGDGLTAAAAFTGRVNLFAATAGLAVIDRARLDRLNRVHESITVATLPEFAPVEPKMMVATIKIIPFAAPKAAVDVVLAAVGDGAGPVLRVAPYRPRPVAMVQTVLPATKPGVLDKTVHATEGRLAALGSQLIAEQRTAHDTAALAEKLSELTAKAELVLIVGASAITDRRDVLPAAIEAAGGRVEHFGMPVDPGNLLLFGAIGDVPVIGLPGCARSPKLNGFDWVLQRLLADQPVGRDEIMAMGVGGLLAEIPSRPLPRAEAVPAMAVPRAPRIAALVLAAGQSRRMGRNKLLIPVSGKPMVAHAVDAVLASQAEPAIVVTGHQADEVAAALQGRNVRLVHNRDYAEGLATSLRAGLAAVPEWADGVVIALGDMPLVGPKLIDRLIAAYAPVEGRAIIVATRIGQRGNPVLWDKRFFAEMRGVAGDVGARHLIGANAELVVEIEADDDAPLVDIDTPEALQRLIA